MSVTSEIQRIQNNIAAAYTVASDKGATLPLTENSYNLADCIDTIITGGGDNTRVFNTNFWLDTSDHMHNFGTDVNNEPLDVIGWVLSTRASLITIDQAYRNAYKNNTDIVLVDLSGITSISGSLAFASAFESSYLAGIDLSSLEEISGNFALAGAFKNCAITELSFPSLSSVTAVNCMDSMLSGVDGCMLHFPSNMQTTISGLTGYPNFGGTDTHVYFDLPPVNLS